jgi:hypothetical protein
MEEAQGFGGSSYPAAAEALEWERAAPSRLSGYPTSCTYHFAGIIVIVRRYNCALEKR